MNKKKYYYVTDNKRKLSWYIVPFKNVTCHLCNNLHPTEGAIVLLDSRKNRKLISNIKEFRKEIMHRVNHLLDNKTVNEFDVECICWDCINRNARQEHYKVREITEKKMERIVLERSI